LLLARFEPATSVRKADGALTEVTDIFTTAVPTRMGLRFGKRKSTLGNGRHRRTTTETQVWPKGLAGARDASIPPDGFHGTID
jgi:hypothetical protein